MGLHTIHTQNQPSTNATQKKKHIHGNTTDHHLSCLCCHDTTCNHKPPTRMNAPCAKDAVLIAQKSSTQEEKHIFKKCHSSATRVSAVRNQQIPQVAPTQRPPTTNNVRMRSGRRCLSSSGVRGVRLPPAVRQARLS